MQHARDRVRDITARERLLPPIEDILQDLNRYLRGWAGYFRYGNSARHFNLIEHHAHNRLARCSWPNATSRRGPTAGESSHTPRPTAWG
jgi:RNA-directed DNA polymerase